MSDCNPWHYEVSKGRLVIRFRDAVLYDGPSKQIYKDPTLGNWIRRAVVLNDDLVNQADVILNAKNVKHPLKQTKL